MQTAVGEAGRFTPHLLVQGGPDNGWLPVPADRSQIAYGAEATLENLVRTADAAHRPAFDDLAGIAAVLVLRQQRLGPADLRPGDRRDLRRRRP